MSYNIDELENEIFQNWESKKIFHQTLEKNKDKPSFTFYDGPPFATGNPHYGHILAGSIKDTICRHAQFKGFNVERRAGFDCHGLPVEYEIEKELGIKNYDEIMKYGIKNYNDACRGIVLRCADYWKKFMTRYGRWIDFENGYKTMDFNYMQSVWSVFKDLWDKKLVYQGFRVMPYSTACGTPLSNFEANSNYKKVNDESVIIKFKSKDKDFSFLVWTTTPWTLPSNMALCVNPEYSYSVYELEDEKYLICDTLVKNVFGIGKKMKLPKNLKKLESYTGLQLVGEEYNAIFSFYEDIKLKVIADDYVKDNSGTGIVHIAPAFGEDDFRVSVNNGIITSHGEGIRCPVDRNGCFTEPLPEKYQTRNVKECDKDLTNEMKHNGSLFKRVNMAHDYPFCWRSDTPLIYKAVPSWFIEVTKIKDQLLSSNSKTKWVPDNIRSGRFHNWLADAKDWGISRSRFWGTPIPIWTDGEEFICVGDAKELEQLAGLKEGTITDIHRENVDNIKIISPKTGNTLERIEFVFDCWFESGSMPFASQNYHLDKNVKFPADFIAEGLDQTRGWFYTLLVIGVGLRNVSPYTNVIVNGLVKAEDGKKMSKRLKNYPDPQKVIDQYGSDALRMYLISSPAVKAEDLSFKERGIQEVLRTVTIPLMSAYKFYNEHKMKIEKLGNLHVNLKHIKNNNTFDKWIIYKFNEYKNMIINNLDNYILNKLHKLTEKFIDDLNNTYLKFNRNRLKGKLTHEDHLASLSVLGKILYNFSILSTSFLPYFSEYLFSRLKVSYTDKDVDSVHLLSYDDLTIKNIDYLDDFSKIDNLVKIVNLVRIIRCNEKLNSKIPMINLRVCSNNKNMLGDFEEYLKTEGNIMNITYDDINKYTSINYIPNRSLIGKTFKGQSKEVMKYILSLNNLSDKINDNELKYNLNLSYFNIERSTVDIDNYKYMLSEDSELLVYLNTQQNEETNKMYIARLIVYNIQQLRKDLKLRPWNKIKINIISDSNIIKIILEKFYDYIYQIVSNPVFLNSKINNQKIGSNQCKMTEIDVIIEIYNAEQEMVLN